MTPFIVRKVAVLGAGVMGAQIAAHLVNAKVDVMLFDLPAKDGDKSAIAKKAIEGLKKLSPAPLGHAEPPIVLIDRELLALDQIWAAAGTPHSVFHLTADELIRISGGTVADVKQGD